MRTEESKKKISHFRTSLLLVGVLLFAQFSATAQIIKGYIPDYGTPQIVGDIHYSDLTDVLYIVSFSTANIYVDANGNIQEPNNSLFTTVKTNCANNNVNLWFSVQDTNPATNFSKIAGDPTALKNFVTQCAEFCANNGLKGVDLDWETPKSSENQNFIALLSQLRLALNIETNTTGKPYQISIAVPDYTSSNGIGANVLPYVDYLDVMAYDGGAGSKNSPLGLMVNEMADWANVGCPYSKMVPGIPFYGRDANNNAEQYYLINPGAGLESVYESDFYNSYYYNGLFTIQQKVNYAKSKGCAGVFAWELTQDRFENDSFRLLTAIKNAMNGTTSGGVTCTTPAAPTATFGATDCSNGSSVNGTSLAFISNGGTTFKGQVSQYPYGSSNIVYTSACQNSTSAFSVPSLVPGMLYRWNMYAYGATDCTSCQSPVSNTLYFSLPPVISSTSTQITSGQSVTLSTSAQGPGAGANVNYRWMLNGNLLQQGSTLTSIQVNSAGSYSLVIDYSGSGNCAGTSSTPVSNIIILSANGAGCTASVPPTGIQQTNVTTQNGPAVQLTVVGGSLGTNANWMWYTGGCGGQLIASNTNSITVNPTVSTEYFVQAMGDCGPSGCATTTVTTPCTSSVPPSYITVGPANTPDGIQTLLTIVGGSLGTNATWRVYEGSCGGNLIGSGHANTFIVNPSATTTYYIRAEGCDTSECTSVNVLVCTNSVQPSSIVSSGDNILPGTPITLTVNGGSLGTNASWQLYSGSCGGTVAGSGTGNVFNVSPQVTTTYYVQAIGSCNTTPCDSVTIHVIPPPSVTSVVPLTAEKGTEVTITGSNFQNTSQLTFGGQAPASFTVLSGTQIKAVIDTGATGVISITTPGGTTTFPGFTFEYSLPSNNFTVSTTSATCIGVSDGKIEISSSNNLSYVATTTYNGVDTKSDFTTDLLLDKLPAGAYHICITVGGHPEFQQCYDLQVGQPADLSVYTAVNVDNTLTLSLNGGNSYNILLNGRSYSTTSNSITLPLTFGDNNLSVTTDKLCQGSYQQVINILKTIVPFPDPFTNTLNIDLGPEKINSAVFEVHNNSTGRVLYSKLLFGQSGVVQLDLGELREGVYILHIRLDNIERVFKIIKQ